MLLLLLRQSRFAEQAVDRSFSERVRLKIFNGEYRTSQFVKYIKANLISIAVK